MNREAIRMLAETHESFYLYDGREIASAAEKLTDAFAGVQFLYSVKANPCPQIVKQLAEMGFGADAASADEVLLALACGMSADKIQYSAPGKTEEDIRLAAGKCIITADSIGELELLQEYAEANKIILSVGVRINPSAGIGGTPAGPSKFGIDEEDALGIFERKPYTNLKLVGIHVHLKSQMLNESLIESYYKAVLDTAKRLRSANGEKFKFVNLGSGIGIPYSGAASELKLDNLSSFLKKSSEKLNSLTDELCIESGRYLVCRAGVYVTHVADKKISCGKTFVILRNTLNGFLRPSLASLLESFIACPPASEPLYTGKDEFALIPLEIRDKHEKVTVCGNLCTSADTVLKDKILPELRRGDAVIFTNAGSYAAVLSPFRFSSQKPPRIFYLDHDGKVSRGE